MKRGRKVVNVSLAETWDHVFSGLVLKMIYVNTVGAGIAFLMLLTKILIWTKARMMDNEARNRRQMEFMEEIMRTVRK